MTILGDVKVLSPSLFWNEEEECPETNSRVYWLQQNGLSAKLISHDELYVIIENGSIKEVLAFGAHDANEFGAVDILKNGSLDTSTLRFLEKFAEDIDDIVSMHIQESVTYAPVVTITTRIDINFNRVFLNLTSEFSDIDNHVSTLMKEKATEFE